MDTFVSRKRQRLSSPTSSRKTKELNPTSDQPIPSQTPAASAAAAASAAKEEDDSTEVKLATLASLYPFVEQSLLLDILLANQGSVEDASRVLSSDPKSCTTPHKPKPAHASNSYQSSLASFSSAAIPDASRPVTKKGRTLHLYSPEQVAAHTPCSIIHNFLPAEEANDLLRELLDEVPTFKSATFKLFDNYVQSPHTACFYVQSVDEQRRQKTEYLYNGAYLTDVRQITPYMRQVSSKVEAAVNREIVCRIRTHYPGGKKLKYQSPKEWIPNAAFVNCYAGGNESVGYHSDQLTYLGPRAVIGSLSLGVTREFRVRKVIPREEKDDADSAGDPHKTPQDHEDHHRADMEGQIAIHLPHNSLLVMHAEMQEEWKHSIAPAQAIDPHPIAGNKRINITYRCYRDSFHPRFTPRCKCDMATVLRCVQRKKENWGRYFWMCHAGLQPGKQG
ncbi:MAG: hypothetical protein M1816_007867 [Peltula sp. TS41687]|nr:MAG: hypothetical protein M1816_007867 [Peltula sp. TS41687]